MSYVLGILHLSGHLQPAFWQHAPELNLRILPWISLSVALSHGAFAITFLRLRERQRWAYRALITVMVLLTLSHVAIPQQLLVSLTLFGIGEALIAVIAVSAVATRLPGALWYAAGSAAFAVFAIGLFGVSCLGFNPWHAVYLMDYFRIGCLLEIICFCGAQVLRVLDLRRQSAELRKRQVDDARALIDAMQALNSAHEQATSNRLMLATTSHDLAQPLSALRMTVQALQSQDTPHPDHFKQIDANLQYVQSMLHSVLDKARAEQHQNRQAELLVLGELFAEVAHRHLVSAHAKGLRLTWLDSTREVRAPALVLQRVLDNLVSNAVRYTLRGRVALGARWRQDVLELKVLDTGIGLSSRQFAALQHPFHQAAPQAAQGHGMGLHIVRSLCAESGYRFSVQSTPTRGSCFSIHIPNAKPEAPHPQIR